MQVVILAGGRGVRMGRLTDNTPKPLLKVSGKSLIEHKLDILPERFSEVVILLSYLGDSIQNALGNEYHGRRIQYVTQKKLNGTAGALWAAKDVLGDQFLVMMGDDIYCREDIEKCSHYPWSVLVKRKHLAEGEEFNGGDMRYDEDGRFVEIVYGEHHGSMVSINSAMYSLKKEIFLYEPVPKREGSNELGLPQTLAIVARDIPVQVVESRFWIQVTTPEDIDRAEKLLQKQDS